MATNRQPRQHRSRAALRPPEVILPHLRKGFAQNILGDVNPDGIVRKTGAQGAAKTFTQDEVNDLIKARLERERKGQPSKEDLAAFHKWQDDQKSAEQKSAEAIKVQSDRADAAEKKAAALEAKLLATSKGVKPTRRTT